MISWLGPAGREGAGLALRGQIIVGVPQWSPQLVLNCAPGNLGPAAAHYTRNASSGQMPGVWWHINNRVTTGPGHL